MRHGRTLRHTLLGLMGVGLVAAAVLFVRGPSVADLAGPFPPSDSSRTSGLLPGTVVQVVAKKVAQAHQEGVRPGNEEALSLLTPPPAKVAFLFLHGFGASREEGVQVVDELARRLQANVYYARLPGHGGGTEAHARARAEDYLRTADEALSIARALGERVFVVGSSTGGLLATWLASRRPADVDGLLLASPLFGFVRKEAYLTGFPGVARALDLLGPRDCSWAEDPEGRKRPGYEDHWLMTQAYAPLHELNRLLAHASADGVLRAVRTPVLLLAYYKDEQHQDDTASVDAMRRAFIKMTARQNREASESFAVSRFVEVADGHHILTSAYVRVDTEKVVNESLSFVEEVLGGRRAPSR